METRQVIRHGIKHDNMQWQLLVVKINIRAKLMLCLLPPLITDAQ